MAILLSVLSMCATLIGGLAAVRIGESKRLLYLATADILPEAHAGKPARGPLLCTLAGVLFMLAVAALSH